MDFINKVQQFLTDEQELLADFLLDMEDAEGNREQTKAAALWAMQTARVGAIKDVLQLVTDSTK